MNLTKRTIEITVDMDFPNNELDIKISHDFSDDKQVMTVLQKILDNHKEGSKLRGHSFEHLYILEPKHGAMIYEKMFKALNKNNEYDETNKYKLVDEWLAKGNLSVQELSDDLETDIRNGQSYEELEKFIDGIVDLYILTIK